MNTHGAFTREKLTSKAGQEIQKKQQLGLIQTQLNIMTTNIEYFKKYMT